METTDKPFRIEKRRVYEAYKAVKSNQRRGRRGRADDRAVRSQSEGQSLQDLESDEFGKLLSTAGQAVSIPKKSGGERILGVPTVSDRIAQMVVKQLIEPDLEPIFLPDSYGYRPGKSALDAVGVTRERCWRYDWVLEFDIKGLFDNICPRSAAEGGSKACEMRMGGALHRKMADSADGKRRETCSANARNPSGRRDQSYTCPISSCTMRSTSG